MCLHYSRTRSGIVSYTKQYAKEATAAHNAGKRYFLGETNSGKVIEL